MIPCKLIHHTGTMIRFRTSQLGGPPRSTCDIQLMLPTGRVVDARFVHNRANPNVSGVELVRYIKGQMTFGAQQDVLVEQRSPTLWVLYLLEDAVALAADAHVPTSRLRNGALRPADLATLLAFADRENERGRRIETYRRVLRPNGLRRLLVGVVGAQCMADGCPACERFDVEWGPGSGQVVVEVHHIEEVARTIDHHPRNLCILCANHHRFVHGSGSWSIRHEGPDVVFGRIGREMLIRRPASIFLAA